MRSHISALIAYFERELPELKNNYQWKIPEIEGFGKSGEKGYLANIELKKYFNTKWLESNSRERLKLSKTIVEEWGRVRGNKPSTLKSYVEVIENETPLTPLKGVASYSKIFSVTDLEKYAIYDARVAVSLNAVQWNANIEGVAFNYISGRNKITGNFLTKSGFAYQEQFKVESLKNAGWKELKKDETYNYYLNTLAECLQYFPEFKLYDLEMVLFANAEKVCTQAMNSV